MAARTERIQNYKIGKTVGIGSFGKVKLGEHEQTGLKVAIKILNRSKITKMGMEAKVWREIQILEMFSHPHIIKLYEVIQTETDVYVVMEYVSGGELFDHIVSKGRISEDEARYFFQQLIAGVECCHAHRVVHRDLKPENLLLDSDNQLKIADFGLSNNMVDGAFLFTSCGSPNYAAPEVISGRCYAGPEVDIWSCGVILYSLVCGNLPFDDDNVPNLFKKIKGGQFSIPNYLPEGVKDLIQGMLVVDPLRRLSLTAIRRHPWFSVRLPRYLEMHNHLNCGTDINMAIVGEAARLCNVSPSEVHQQLSVKSSRSAATVSYHLLCDNQKTHSRTAAVDIARPCVATENSFPEFFLGRNYSHSSLRNGWDYSSIPAGALAHSLDHLSLKSVVCRPSSLPSRRCPAPTVASLLSHAATPPNVSTSAAVLDVEAPEEASFGIFSLGMQSKKPPAVLMRELYRVFTLCKVSWVKTAPYCLKARFQYMRHAAPPSPSGDKEAASPGSQETINFRVNMYQTDDGVNVLDFQQEKGEDSMAFLYLARHLVGRAQL